MLSSDTAQTLAQAPVQPPVYTIWFANGTRRGTAFKLLDGIRKRGRSGALKKMTTEQYAAAIIKDVAFFLPRNLLAFLRKQAYASDFDRALRYLSEMPTSGVRILAQNGDVRAG